MRSLHACIAPCRRGAIARQAAGSDMAAEAVRKVMANHYASIGFRIETPDDLGELAEQLAADAEPIKVSNGHYLRWSSPSGAEIWLQADRSNVGVGAAPHFAGEAELRAQLTGRVTREDDTELDGAFRAIVDPSDEPPIGGAYPLVFDSPDFLCHRDLSLPATLSVQVAAFAHEITVYDTVAAYKAAHPGPGTFASRSLIPSGTFEPGGAAIEPPLAQAIMTGHVRRSGRRVNEHSGLPFHWAEIESYCAVFDVVIDPELVGAAPPVGGVVQGTFWLSGRPRPTRKRTLLDRLLGRRTVH